MHTITILAEALAEASRLEILRLDMKYDHETESYTGRAIIGYGREYDSWLVYDIHDNGTIELVPYTDPT